MFLSKILVERRRVYNPYELHRALWTIFPGHEHNTRGFLFRVEAERPGSATDLLLQSAWQPAPQSAEVHVVATRPYHLRLRQGQALRFRLTGNPIKTIKDDTGRQNAKGAIKSCRVPLVIEEQQLQWLQRKLHNAARIDAAVIQAQRPLYFRKDNKAGKIVTVTFDGLLRVLDPALLWLQMQQGIGPAKSFGCGLLSVMHA
jgi:CRISPR system Cascade subunit CasE